MSTIVTRTGKGSALTWAEGDANFNNLNSDKLENIALRGDSGSDAVITSNEIVRISGGTGLSSVVTAESTGQSTVTINLDNTTVTPNTYTLATITVDAQGRITSASSGTGGGGLSNVVEDLTPQLGGALDVNGYAITSVSNANVEISPNGTGDVYLTADTIRVGDSNTNVTITTNGTGDLILNTNSGSSSGSITIADGANGNISIAPNGTGFVEIPGTASTSGRIKLYEELSSAANTNSVTLRAPQILQADVTLTLPSTTTSATLGYLNIPAVGAKTGSYTLTTADVGEYVEVQSGGSITIPNSTFSAGDIVVIVNNHSAAITITCSITDAYIAGTDTDKATVSLATRGIANIFFVSGTRCIITGNIT